MPIAVSKGMKIVHIITRLILGGAQENTLITCKALAQRGHDVTLVTGPALGPEGELFNQAKGQGYEIVVVDRLRRAINPLNDIPSYFQIKKLLRQLQPDIVHTHSAKAGILGRFAGYALKGQWTENLPVVVHGIHGLAFHPYQSPVLNKFYIAVEKSAAKRTDFFISVADAMTEQATVVGIGRLEQYVTAYSAIEEEPTCPRCGGKRLTRLISRVAVVRSEESRLDDMADPSMLDGLDEEDPKSLARWMRKMSAEMGEEMPQEFDEGVDRLESGQSPEEIEEALPDLGDDLGGMDDLG